MWRARLARVVNAAAGGGAKKKKKQKMGNVAPDSAAKTWRKGQAGTAAAPSHNSVARDEDKSDIDHKGVDEDLEEASSAGKQASNQAIKHRYVLVVIGGIASVISDDDDDGGGGAGEIESEDDVKAFMEKRHSKVIGKMEAEFAKLRGVMCHGVMGDGDCDDGSSTREKEWKTCLSFWNSSS